MKDPVALFGGSPAYRHGLATALRDAGFSVEQPDDPRRWASQRGNRAVVVTMGAGAEAQILHDFLSAGPEVQLVALLTETTADAYREALRFGACGVVGRDAPLPEIVETVRAALRGRTLLPRDIALGVASGNAGQPAAVELSEQEMLWLQGLASGTTVTELAEQVGYSERELYRLLKRLYARLGVERRSEALVRAGTLGLVD